jgi:hypothetical protein
MAKSKKEKAEEVQAEANGKAVGVYFDKEKKRFIMVTLDLYPDSDSAEIIERETLTGSKLAAMLKSEVKLNQVLNKTLKEK